MAYSEMNTAPAKDGGVKSRAFEYSDSLAAATNGTSILIPDDISSITVTVKPSGTTAKAQSTTSPVDTVKAGTEVWVDWDLGSVSVATQDACKPVTAIRMVQDGAGSSIITVRAQ